MIEEEIRKQTYKIFQKVCRTFYLKVVNLRDDIHKVCIFRVYMTSQHINPTPTSNPLLIHFEKYIMSE